MKIVPVEEILGRQVPRAQVGDAGVQEGVEIGENDRLYLPQSSGPNQNTTEVK